MTKKQRVLPHGDVETIADDVFMVRGSVMINPIIRFTRNMAIVREGDQLSLINPIAVDDVVEAQIEALGKIANVVRLGPFHGMDDPYYVDKFGASMWAPPGGLIYAEPAIDHELGAAQPLPFQNATIFEFSHAVQPECAVLLNSGSGILLTCDGIQHYGDYSYCNLPARLISPLIGFPKTTIVGPIWLKAMTPEGGSLEPDFRDLLKLEFDTLLASHGTLLKAGAHAAVERAIDKAFTTP